MFWTIQYKIIYAYSIDKPSKVAATAKTKELTYGIRSNGGNFVVRICYFRVWASAVSQSKTDW